MHFWRQALAYLLVGVKLEEEGREQSSTNSQAMTFTDFQVMRAVPLCSPSCEAHPSHFPAPASLGIGGGGENVKHTGVMVALATIEVLCYLDGYPVVTMATHPGSSH